MIKQLPLPYNFNALEPVFSEKTLHFHYEKHYLGYVNVTNSLIKGTNLENKSLKEIILSSAKKSSQTKLFNNSAQVWNHEFYWNSLTPNLQKQNLSSELMELINKDFGSLTKLKENLIEQGLNRFASGWLWLVLEKGHLNIVTTSNADTPLLNSDLQPLLCLDLWEHAYYLDYQNLRKEYLIGCINNLLNWEFAGNNLKRIP